jgi:hypothetical protein
VPDNPVIQYHLGMAAVKAGDRETAKRALTVAAGSARPFPGQDDARTALRTLQ